MSTADLHNPTRPLRLYHLAREWEISPAVLVALLRSGGLEVDSHFTQVQREAIPELKATLARGREAAAKAKAEAEAAAEAEAKAEAEAEAQAEPEPVEPVALEKSPQDTATQEEPAKKKKKRKRTRKTKRPTEKTKRPTRSLYGSGRLTPSEPAPAPKPRSDNDVAPSLPSFGKREVAPPPKVVTPTPAKPADTTRPAQQEPSSRWSVPAFGNVATARPPTPTNGAQVVAAPVASAQAPATPPTEPTPSAEADPQNAPSSSGGLAILVLGIVAIAVAALLFALSQR